ncbi:uncharacterized protein LOC133314024 [Gastrolobium bilobum]|uniref:uncharacterized protein LOC133314024 n=1 Tax=Gastrolobium bilobum TaxID=150636 RepID=UPI002AB1C58B|nr:uncharacterized protein LOC133314024 [Gastrolobium bilobum]
MEGTSTRSGKIRGMNVKHSGTPKKLEAIPTFINERAVKRHEVMLKRNLLSDRGFVQEFHANMPQSKSTKVMVRGTSVSFSNATIKRVYNLPTIVDEYQGLKTTNDEEFLKQVLEDLCVEGTTWTESAQKSLSFLRSALKLEARVWYHFLKSRLKPTSHTETVNKERAILLSCILDGRPIDVGRIIQAEIVACSKTDTGYLFFPGLITQLCQEANVPIADDEERFQITEPITPYTTERVSKKAKVLAGETISSPKSRGKNAAASTSTVAGEEDSIWKKRIDDRLKKIENDQMETRKEIMDKLNNMDNFILAQLGFLKAPEQKEGQSKAAASEEEEAAAEEEDEAAEEKEKEEEEKEGDSD